MQKILVDSGPLIALFDRDDDAHHKALTFIKSFKGQMFSSWLVLTEVSHLLDFSVKAQLDFLTWIERRGVMVKNLEMNDIPEILKLTVKYRDRPMDLADASLVILARKLAIHEIASLDSDFSIYRLPNKKRFKNVLNS